MFCIFLEETDPFFCLATEEYLLKNYTEDIFMLWQCLDTVVVGKHQNAMAEINYRYIRENGIKVARRISGGGAVFHDRGNVNFSFFKNVQGPHEINFKKFTEPVTGALKRLGIPAETSGRNDLLVHGKKISGNAEHVFKNRVLHHGTLLFNSDLMHLGDSIRVIPGKYTGKATPSNRSEVTNITEYLIEKITLEQFIRHLLDYQLGMVPGSTIFRIPENDKRQIGLLSLGKFETREWQYGNSPAYLFSNSVEVNHKKLNLKLSVDKGKIGRAEITGNFYAPETARQLESLLTGRAHQYESIEESHQILNIATDKDLIYCYF